MRFFPLGAKGDTHVPLRVVEDLQSDTRLEVHLAAPEASSGFAVIDIGLVEI
jgi:assimilatory nitrate reductase catalytic subunit